MNAYRTDTGSAVVEWPSTPDPVDPDAYDVPPSLIVTEARRDARRQSARAFLLFGFIMAFLVSCIIGAAVALAQPAAPPIPEPKPRGMGPAPRTPCHSAAEIAKQLSNKYDEAPVAFGLQSNGNLLQVYSSDAKDTWTVVSTTPAGMSCIVAVGNGWENLPVGLPIGYGEP